MDENLARLNRIYPNSDFVEIAPYKEEVFKDKNYDSSFDTKSTNTKWRTKPLNYEQAQEVLDKGGRIGWVIPTGFVVIDIDNKDNPLSQEYIEKILQKFEVNYNYNYTSKGIHILLADKSEKIKSIAKYKCALNIEIDTRANKSGYIVLPSNDPHRRWGRWNDFVEDIPYFLKPIAIDTTNSFIGMTDGDGRNNALFKWRTLLERTNLLNEEQIEKSIRIINENLFDTPMPNNELFKTVLRSKEKLKPDATEKENLYNKLANDIIAKYDIIAYYDTFYKFNGTYYKKLTNLELEKMIHYDISTNLSRAARQEIIEFIKVKQQVNIEEFDKDWYKIACKNGILNLVTGELEQPNKADINTIYIPYEYTDDPVYSPRIDEFMKQLTNGDFAKMEFLYQIAGYCLLKKNIFAKFVICKGEGGTGKSTYTNLLQKLVGDDLNCSHVALSNFDKDYYLASIAGKLLNIDDDVVDGKALENTGRFKSIVSGDKISCRQIYREVMDFYPYCTCIFSCNRLPRIMDKTTGLYRRMILIELNHKVENPDPLFMNKITESDMQYFLYKAVEGIKTAIEEGHFRISQSEQQLLETFKRRQSALHEWLYETEITLGMLQNQRCLSLYSQFTAWAQENGYGKIINNFTFKEDICALYDMQVVSRPLEGKTIPVQLFFKQGEINNDYRPF